MRLSDIRRCLVIDGQPLLRIGIRNLLAPRYEVEEATSLSAARELVTATGEFDVAVLELDRRDPGRRASGPTLVKGIRRSMPGAGIVAYVREGCPHAAGNARGAGANAIVAKTSPTEALVEAIDAAAEGRDWTDPATEKGRAETSSLTRRQQEILQLLANGSSTAAAAERLGLSVETVRTHAKGTITRLGARDRTHAVAIGLRAGLID